jgi:hypothetical protein
MAAMHPVAIRQEIIDRVMARRGRLRWFERLEPAKTALVAIDMQSAFCATGAVAEVPAARAIVPQLNRLRACRRHHRGERCSSPGPRPTCAANPLRAMR